ncbi:hypothetical protein BPAE_0238g00120 [Botrytis paeoniae]|uniref:Uncharacterized protein n=1 Tax=Botrytis paeoniae TaxID=278948 RepID=A0A4Z1FHX1_9HELO|nr:hypothetical protein BPAE_0238g00120 [Botrytis paeoniae]
MPHDAAPRPQQRGSETAMINGMCESEGSGGESSDLDRNAIQRQRQNRDSPELASAGVLGCSYLRMGNN